MNELDMIIDNKNNSNFHLKNFFYQLIIVDNQNIFNIKGKIKLHFFWNYNKGISINLAL